MTPPPIPQWCLDAAKEIAVLSSVFEGVRADEIAAIIARHAPQEEPLLGGKYRIAFDALCQIAAGSTNPQGVASDAMQACVDLGGDAHEAVERSPGFAAPLIPSDPASGAVPQEEQAKKLAEALENLLAKPMSFDVAKESAAVLRAYKSAATPTPPAE